MFLLIFMVNESISPGPIRGRWWRWNKEEGLFSTCFEAIKFAEFFLTLKSVSFTFSASKIKVMPARLILL